MSVAEKTVAEKPPRSPHQQLAASSLLGALYVLFSLGMVFSGLPYLWGTLETIIQNEFLSSALLLIVEIGACVGFVFFGKALETPRTATAHPERATPPPGFRAGVLFTCLAILGIVWLAQGFGMLLYNAEFGEAKMVYGLMIALALGLAFVVARLLFRPDFAAWLCHVEDQGWFHAIPYKANQGMRVRRGSILALLVLGACGIYTLLSHGALGNDRLGVPNNWEMDLPFADVAIPIMYRVHYTIPLVLIGLMFWVSWRLVNWPVFADFLIATEAEMNKVSWTTRKRLFQDTIVVLVTVFLLTAFLFLMDILWINILKSDLIKVISVDIRQEQLKQQEKTQW